MTIFVGTEPAQARALRVLLFSIERTRDPGRAYHVHVMSRLAGFAQRGRDRTRGSSRALASYGFAVPHYAHGAGKAIYCEVGRVFLADPAELFDLELRGASGRSHGYLATSDDDASVMLLDCARMAQTWKIRDVRTQSAATMLRRTVSEPYIRGPLDPRWNARDGAWVPGRSKLLSFTAPRTQPWRPFPERFVYRPHPHAGIWCELERAALAEGFTGFDADRPTRAFAALREQGADAARGSAGRDAPADAAIREIVAAERGDSLLELREADVRAGRPARPGARADDLLEFLSRPAAAEPVDAIVCSAPLDALPAEDVPWVLDVLFQNAKSAVVVVARCRAAHRRARRPGLLADTWWIAEVSAAAARHPEIRWHLVLLRDGAATPWLRRGGPPAAGAAPRIWVLTDDRPGNTTQSLGLAESLGLEFETIELAFRARSPVSRVPLPLLGARALALTSASRRRLAPPWPDLVIAAGRRTAPVARWIAERSRGRTRTVALGRKGSNPARAFDLAVSPAHCGLHPHPNRLETTGALTRMSASRLAEAAVAWKPLFDGRPRPHVALLVGGGSSDHALSPAIARRVALDVRAMVRRAGGSLYVTTSRRTTAEVASALEEAVEGCASFHRFDPDRPDENPYAGYLALADAIVVTGESESMLAEAAASGCPVLIYELPLRRGSLAVRAAKTVVDRIVARAASPDLGIAHACARLVDGGWVRPNRNLAALHDAMIAAGIATRFDGTLREGRIPRDPEVLAVAGRVRAMLGVGDADAAIAGEELG